MIHQNSYKEESTRLVDRLFEIQYRCELTKVDLAILYSAPIEFQYTDPKVSLSGSHLTAISGVTVTEINRNQEGVQDMLLGRSRNSLGEEFYKVCNVTPLQYANLPVSSMAEILYCKGSVSLINPLDSVSIYTDIGNYLTHLKERILLEPHFIPPPQEDIDAFTELYNIIENLAVTYINMGKGNNSLAALKNLIITTSSGLAQKENKIHFNGRDKKAVVNDTNYFSDINSLFNQR